MPGQKMAVPSESGQFERGARESTDGRIPAIKMDGLEALGVASQRFRTQPKRCLLKVGGVSVLDFSIVCLVLSSA